MKKTCVSRFVAPAVATLCVSYGARADQAADAWNAWNQAFLVQGNGQTYYSGNPVAEAPDSNPGGWTGALTIEVAEDEYQRDHTSAQRQLVNDLVTTFLNDSGPTVGAWCIETFSPTDHWKDGWNDDLGWMITAVLHGYQITGNADFLSVARGIWDCAYARGWDTNYGGGGIWELMDNASPTSNFQKPSKCTLSNDPFIIWGVALYQITGQTSYLTHAEEIYAWVRAHFLDSKTGKVHECWGFAGSSDTAGYLQGNDDDHLYDSGTFLQSAEALYRITGDDAYHQDALLVINHRMSVDPVLACKGGVGSCEGNGSEWAYPFAKGLGEFATFNGAWSPYQAWMQKSADAAWNMRNALNVTWNDWTTATPVFPYAQDASSNTLSPLDTRGAVGIWEFLPQLLDPGLVGAFELKNVGSSLSLTTGGAGDGGVGVVQQPFESSGEWLWTFVPTNGGYYRIQNVSNGLLLAVEANSGAPGSSIVAVPVPTFAQGNEQWLPVANGDGSYSFYNLSSILALDTPGASTTPGTQCDQWFGNGGKGQAFQVVQHAAVSAGDAGNAEAGAIPGDGGSARDAAPLPPLSEAGAPAPPPPDASSDGTRDGESTAASGCGCRTAGAAPAPAPFGGLALLALGCAFAVRRRPASSTRR